MYQSGVIGIMLVFACSITYLNNLKCKVEVSISQSFHKDVLFSHSPSLSPMFFSPLFSPPIPLLLLLSFSSPFLFHRPRRLHKGSYHTKG